MAGMSERFVKLLLMVPLPEREAASSGRYERTGHCTTVDTTNRRFSLKSGAKKLA